MGQRDFPPASSRRVGSINHAAHDRFGGAPSAWYAAIVDDAHGGERDKLREERARLEREIAKNLRDRETLLSRLVDSSVATSFMEEKLAGNAAIVAQMQERVAELIAEDRNLDSVVIDADFVRNALTRLEGAIKLATLPPDEMALLVRTVIERVEIDGDAPMRLSLWGQKQPPERFRSFAD
jgi:hypothetical protein